MLFLSLFSSSSSPPDRRDEQQKATLLPHIVAYYLILSPPLRLHSPVLSFSLTFLTSPPLLLVFPFFTLLCPRGHSLLSLLPSKLFSFSSPSPVILFPPFFLLFPPFLSYCISSLLFQSCLCLKCPLLLYILLCAPSSLPSFEPLSKFPPFLTLSTPSLLSLSILHCALLFFCCHFLTFHFHLFANTFASCFLFFALLL